MPVNGYHYTVWWPSMCLLNLAIQDVASMAAKTCSLGSLCKQYLILYGGRAMGRTHTV